jgi:hypothetical protein
VHEGSGGVGLWRLGGRRGGVLGGPPSGLAGQVTRGRAPGEVSRKQGVARWAAMGARSSGAEGRVAPWRVGSWRRWGTGLGRLCCLGERSEVRERDSRVGERREEGGGWEREPGVRLLRVRGRAAVGPFGPNGG